MDVQFDIEGRLVPIEELEARLVAPTIVQTLRRVVDKLAQQPDIILCAEHEEPPAIIVTPHATGVGLRVSGCCQPFVQKVQASLKGTLAAVNPTSDSLVGLILMVRLPEWDKAFDFEIARIDRLIIGRLDPDTGQRPDIDLSTYGGYDNGVSRRHASIMRWYQGLFITDEGSPNGTYLNEQKLIPNLPYVLKFGDKIRIGRLVMEVRLTYPQGEST